MKEGPAQVKPCKGLHLQQRIMLAMYTEPASRRSPLALSSLRLLLRLHKGWRSAGRWRKLRQLRQ